LYIQADQSVDRLIPIQRPLPIYADVKKSVCIECQMFIVDNYQLVIYASFIVASLPLVTSVAIRQSAGRVIRQALHDGRFEPGQSLSDARLATEMGVSRGPVREALLLLVQEGLVTHSPNRGFSVIQITADDLQEIQQVRLPLETLALQLAATRITDNQVRQLELLRDEMVQRYSENDVPLFTQFDISFHSLIWDCTGNTKLASTLKNLLAPYFTFGALFAVHRRPDLSAQLIAEEHHRFIQFLHGTSKQTAEDCVRLHLGL
jgi:DNA-binding GntR family transcriptional regulator